MEHYKDKHKYDDIIYIDYRPSDLKPHMSIHDRAAQFNPFAALTGHDEAVDETATKHLAQIILNDTNDKFEEDA